MALFIKSVSRFQHMSLTDVTYRCDDKLTHSIPSLVPAPKKVLYTRYQRNAGAGVRFLTCTQSCGIVDPIIYTILATDGCPEQFRYCTKNTPQTKIKRHRFCCTWLPSESDSSSTERRRQGKRGGRITRLNLLSTDTPQHTGPSVTHPANHLQDVLEINKMVRVSPNNENKGALMGRAQFAQHTNRAKTSAAVWHLAKPRVLENIHKIKINKKRYTKI